MTNQEFIDIFERHLNTLSSCDDEYDVCLTDGSRIKYANMISTDKLTCGKNKYESGKPIAFKNTCMTLIVNVNGRKGPNKDGKDIYRFFITQNGLFPDGKTDSCEYGVDCGSYVLSNHKIWDGDVKNGETNKKLIYNKKATFTCEDGYRSIANAYNSSHLNAYGICIDNDVWENFHQCSVNYYSYGSSECYDLKGDPLYVRSYKTKEPDLTKARHTAIITDYEPVNGSYYLGALAECESRGLILGVDATGSNSYDTIVDSNGALTYSRCNIRGSFYPDVYACALTHNFGLSNFTSLGDVSNATEKLPIVC